MNRRIATVAVHDVVMAALAFELALFLRYWTYGDPQPLLFQWEGTVIFTGVCAVVFWGMGLYRGIWHYASMADLVAIAKAVTMALLIFLPMLFWVTRLDEFPRTALPIVWVLLVLALAAPRLAYRLFKDGNLSAVLERHPAQRVPVLLVGAGDEAEAFIREVGRARVTGYRVVGIIDDKPKRIGRDIRGVRVLGDLASLPQVVDRLGRAGRRPRRLIIASRRIEGETVAHLLESCEALGLKLSRVPRLTDFTADDGRPITVRPVDVEDLLGRPQQTLDRAAMRALVAGQRVLITGAGGTIGSELTRQIAALGPAHITCMDNGEHALYQIDLELGERFPDVARSAVLGDVRDAARVATVFRRHRPTAVFHAAAFKHVPLVEANPNEGVLTNVLGTLNVAEAAKAAGVTTYVQISTDKAVNPSSVMGASKRVAEMICQGLSLAGGDTHFVTVRFGNVLGSTGSVVPLFQRQLARGGPITVTHPDVVRYFMTTREAVELVLSASALGQAEAGKIYVLDMGKPVKVLDLARQMIRLAGLRPEADIPIQFIGLRPGEKLAEELFHDRETQRTAAPGILLAAPRAIDFGLLRPQLEKLAELAEARRTDDMLAQLHHLVPDYGGPAPRAASASD
ncbi:MAG: nucleoside-diphosphate sugar epimerase/dehydratase [Alphaproteobacteria bacterium]